MKVDWNFILNWLTMFVVLWFFAVMVGMMAAPLLPIADFVGYICLTVITGMIGSVPLTLYFMLATK